MSAQGDNGCANQLSTVIEEEDLYDNDKLYSRRSGTSQKSTEASNSRKSLQVTESSGSDPSASTVPKMSSSFSNHRTIEVGASSGARQLVEKRRTKTSSSQKQSGSVSSKDDKRSIFTLDHVRKIFGSSQRDQQSSPQQTQHGSNSNSSRRSSQASEGSEEFELTKQRLAGITVDNLPAVFLAKYLGEAPAAGLFGVDSIRRPADELVKAAGKRRAKTGRPLPIAQLTVLESGVSVRPHPQSEGGRVDRAFYAIEDVSYAAVDPALRRIFCLVAMKEADDQKKPTCYVFLCNSVETAHRLVLAVTFAFESATPAPAAVRPRDQIASGAYVEYDGGQGFA